MDIRWIDQAATAADLAAAWNSRQWLALDTEFIRERTYFAIPALLQVCDGEAIYLLDVPALGGLALSRHFGNHFDLAMVVALHWVATFVNTPRPPGRSARR